MKCKCVLSHPTQTIRKRSQSHNVSSQGEGLRNADGGRGLGLSDVSKNAWILTITFVIQIRFFEVRTYLSIYHLGVEAFLLRCDFEKLGRLCLPRIVGQSECILPLFNASSEAGSLPFEVRIKNDSDHKNSKFY